MRCDWESYLKILPIWMREYVDRQGRDTLLELRLRIGSPPELVCRYDSLWMHRDVSADDLCFCINTASRYSPWAATSSSRGYVTAIGGHRVGICGKVISSEGMVKGIREPTSVCIRVARDFDGIAAGLQKVDGSILIIGKPGSGKTTLLKDLIRQKSNTGHGSVCVIDEKCELFDHTGGRNFAGKRTDVYFGCSKAHGIDMALRNMSPQIIVIDEITSREDCNTVLHAGWCGVDIIATAHAASKKDLYSRKVYEPIIISGLFNKLVVMNSDKSWTMERMTNDF